ncbi:MAG: NAD(+) diphosphatase [Hyphomicrobium sp.]
MPPALDPSAHLRRDAPRLAELMASPGCRLLVLADDKPVIRSDAQRAVTAIRWFAQAELAAAGHEPDEFTFLGRDASTGAGRFSVSIPAAGPRPDSSAPAVDFRSLVGQGTMSDTDLAIIATAKSLAHWRTRSRFCGSCGGPAALTDGGWKRVCAMCAAEVFPRVDPVVIMLVTDGDRAMLAREPHFPPGMYSALAGFVEPGETLGEAVARETREEVGLTIAEARLVADRPWPMPHSLMLGYIASVKGTATLAPDSTEIEDARWFPRDEVVELAARRHPRGLSLPPKGTIAYMLVERWLADTG